MGTEAQSLGTAVGENVRRLREDRKITQEELSDYCRLAGLDWTRATIASLESGRREDLTISELVLVASVFDVPPATFFEGDGRLLLGDTTYAAVEIPRQSLRSWLGRVTRPGWRDFRIPTPEEHTKALQKVFALDLRLAEQAGISIDQMAKLSRTLWGTESATRERERRVHERILEASHADPVRALHHPPLNRAAVRGHVTRQLTREMKHAIETGIANSDAPTTVGAGTAIFRPADAVALEDLATLEREKTR
jgi:transcriptional regulator with XRE-family HTH domain